MTAVALRRAALLLAGALGLSACAGNYTLVAPRPPAKYESLGMTEGTGCGSKWLVIFPIAFVDFGYGGRLQRALNNALDEKPGATALTHLEVTQTSTWWLLGETDCVTVRGEAIR